MLRYRSRRSLPSHRCRRSRRSTSVALIVTVAKYELALTQGNNASMHRGLQVCASIRAGSRGQIHQRYPRYHFIAYSPHRSTASSCQQCRARSNRVCFFETLSRLMIAEVAALFIAKVRIRFASFLKSIIKAYNSIPAFIRLHPTLTAHCERRRKAYLDYNDNLCWKAKSTSMIFSSRTSAAPSQWPRWDGKLW